MLNGTWVAERMNPTCGIWVVRVERASLTNVTVGRVHDESLSHVDGRGIQLEFRMQPDFMEPMDIGRGMSSDDLRHLADLMDRISDPPMRVELVE